MDLSNANANAINPRRGLDLPLSVLSPLPLAYIFRMGVNELHFASLPILRIPRG